MRRRLRRLLLMVVPATITAVALGSLAPAALASTLQVSNNGQTLTYDAGGGEVNDVRVTFGSGTYTVTDPGATINTSSSSGIPCQSVSAHEATCPAPSVSLLVVWLKDGDDTATNSTATNSELYGESESDRLIGGAGNDKLDGSYGTFDFLQGGAGADTFYGDGAIETSPTFDEVSYQDHSAGITADLDGDKDDGIAGEDWIVSGVEAITGGAGNDRLQQNKGLNTLRGGPGNDVLWAGPQNDPVFSTSVGGDELRGEEGNDTLKNLDFSFQTVLSGGPGTDLADYAIDQDFSASWPVHVSLDAFADDGFQISQEFWWGRVGPESDQVLDDVENVRSGLGADRLTGDADSNRLDGGRGADNLRGEGGDDVILGRGHPPPGAPAQSDRGDQIAGGPGIDTADYSLADAAVNVSLDDEQNDGAADELDSVFAENITGGPFGDTLVGDGSPNRLTGGAGTDNLDGGGGPDVLSGSGGVDLVDYGTRSAALRVTLDGAANDGQLGEGDLVRPDVETVFGGSGNDELVGSPQTNTLVGNAGNDILTGLRGNDFLGGADGADILEGVAGNDSITGGPGNDSLSGGIGADALAGSDGTDLVSYSDHVGPVSVSLDGVADDGAPGEGDDAQPDIEDIGGTEAADTLIGNASANALFGKGGDDQLSGGDSNDVLIADAGNDRLDGGTGADDMLGGTGTDTALYSSRTTRVVVTIDGTPGDGEPGEGDNLELDVENVVGGAGPDSLAGSEAGNELAGNAGNDALIGAGGTDLLDGAGGQDTLDGGLDSDSLLGGPGVDSVLYTTRTKPVVVTLDGNADDGADGEGDSVGIDIENVLGGASDDVLIGSDVANRLTGNGGGDQIVGGAGTDTLSGGGGDDRLDSADGFPDTDLCGAGVDSVRADKLDTVAADCEP